MSREPTELIERIMASSEITEATDRVMVQIRNERWEQLTKHGYDRAHDDEHAEFELAHAAAVLTIYASLPSRDREMAENHGPQLYSTPDIWPWPVHQFRLHDRRTDLIKAAALIVAEIERLDRVSEQ